MLSTQDDWYNTIKRLDDGLIKTPFDEFGNYLGREPTTETKILPPIPDSDDPEPDPPTIVDDDSEEPSFQEAYFIAWNINQSYVCYKSEIVDDFLNNTSDVKEEPELVDKKPIVVKKRPVDYEQYRPYFLDVPIDKVRQTFKVTIQFATNVMSGKNITQTLKSPYPANNVW